jgi:hypothetical protein
MDNHIAQATPRLLRHPLSTFATKPTLEQPNPEGPWGKYPIPDLAACEQFRAAAAWLVWLLRLYPRTPPPACRLGVRTKCLHWIAPFDGSGAREKRREVPEMARFAWLPALQLLQVRSVLNLNQ